MSEDNVETPKQAPRRRWLMPAVIAAGAAAGLLFGLLLPASWLLVSKTPAAAMPGDESAGKAIALNENMRNAIALETAPLEQRLLAREVRTLGIFETDETRTKVVSAWVDGRIDKLYADFTGVPVEKGWHLFDLYSPELYSAQKELIVARDAAAREGLSDSARADAQRMLEIAREKLRLLGLTGDQVTHIETLKGPSRTLTIPSPDSGVVIEKMASEGMYVMQGEPVFRIADLSRLWLIAQIHERDLGWIALGQPVQVEVNAYPGRAFQGRVGFIDPQLDMATRTVRVRVEVPNDDGALKPAMYGFATVYAELAKEARLAAPTLPGKYACPMHPLQRGDDPDKHCEICGMKYEPSEPPAGARPAKVWAVPRSAVLSTGRRHLVYIEHSSRTPPEYEGFEVKLGPLAAEYMAMPDGTRMKMAEYYPLLSGLPTDKPLRIVTNGQFLIDSQMELTGRPSLMRPAGGKVSDPHAGMKMD